jgi:hypothetical protein
MKKVFIPLFILVLAGASFAYDYKIMGGFTLSKYHSYELTPADISAKNKSGLFFGVGFETGSFRTCLEVDLLYFQKNCRCEFKGGSYSFWTDEISVPVMLKLRLTSGTTPFILVGGEGAYIISVQADPGAKRVSYPTANRLDYGLVAGGGLEIWSGDLGIILDGRYHYGLANIEKKGSFSFKTSAIALMLGILF